MPSMGRPIIFILIRLHFAVALRCGRWRLGNDLHFVAVGYVYRRLQDDLLAVLDTLADLDFGAEVGGNRNLVKMGDAVVDDRDLYAVLIEDDRGCRHDQRGCLTRDLKFDGAISPGGQCAVRIGYVDLGQQGPGSRLERVSDPRDVAVESEVGHRRHADDGVNAGGHPKGGVLRHIDPNADHVAVNHGEHRSAARRVGRDQAADIDVPLGYDAVKGGNHLLIDLLLACHPELSRQRRGVKLSRLRCMLLSFKGVSIGVALFQRVPALLGKDRRTLGGDLGQSLVGFILAYRRRGLLQSVLVLGDLVLDLGRGDRRENLAGLDMIANVHEALLDVATGTGVDVGLLESERRSRQCHLQFAAMPHHLIDADARDEVGLLLGSGDDLTMPGVVPPHAESERANKQDEYAEPEEPAPGPARPFGGTRRFARVAIRWWRPRLGRLWRRRSLDVVHSGSSSKTPCASLPSLPLRSIANR